MESSCIDKGTLITVEDGSKVSVEDLKVGDKVQSYNMNSDEFDMSHLDNNEQILAEVVEVNLESVSGEEVCKLSFSNKSVLSVSGCDLYGADDSAGCLLLPSDKDISGEEHVGMAKIKVDDTVYIDSNDSLEDVEVESLDSWANSREMISISIKGGDTVFANGILVSADRKLTEEEEEALELARSAGGDKEVEQEIDLEDVE